MIRMHTESDAIIYQIMRFHTKTTSAKLEVNDIARKSGDLPSTNAYPGHKLSIIIARYWLKMKLSSGHAIAL